MDSEGLFYSSSTSQNPPPESCSVRAGGNVPHTSDPPRRLPFPGATLALPRGHVSSCTAKHAGGRGVLPAPRCCLQTSLPPPKSCPLWSLCPGIPLAPQDPRSHPFTDRFRSSPPTLTCDHVLRILGTPSSILASGPLPGDLVKLFPPLCRRTRCSPGLDPGPPAAGTGPSGFYAPLPPMPSLPSSLTPGPQVPSSGPIALH